MFTKQEARFQSDMSYYESQSDADPWIQINYYELNHKCETFKGKFFFTTVIKHDISVLGFAHKVSIDGGTAGDAFSRFCLGNRVSRATDAHVSGQ